MHRCVKKLLIISCEIPQKFLEVEEQNCRTDFCFRIENYACVAPSLENIVLYKIIFKQKTFKYFVKRNCYSLK